MTRLHRAWTFALLGLACIVISIVGCLPPAAPAPEVMGYGLTGHMTTVDLNKDVERGLLTTVCIHAAYAGATGGLTGFDPTSAALKAFVDKCHAHGARVVLSVANFSTPDTKVLLDSHQDALVAAIHAKVTAAGLDGVSLDLENVTDTTGYRDKYTALCEKVAKSMHDDGLKMYIAVHGIVYTRYDAPKLAALSDGLFIMGYGYHWSGSAKAGPLAIPTSMSAAHLTGPPTRIHGPSCRPGAGWFPWLRWSLRID